LQLQTGAFVDYFNIQILHEAAGAVVARTEMVNKYWRINIWWSQL